MVADTNNPEILNEVEQFFSEKLQIQPMTEDELEKKLEHSLQDVAKKNIFTTDQVRNELRKFMV